MSDERLTAEGVARGIATTALLSTGENAVERYTADVETYGDQRAAEARKAALEPILAMVNVQADDEGIWFDASRISGRQGYLQEELRKLHALIGQLAASPAPEVKGCT